MRKVKEVIKKIFNCSVEEFYSLLNISLQKKFKYFGKQIETCAILNAKSGRCSSDCKFCAQSAKFGLRIKTYPLLEEKKLLGAAFSAFEKGIDRFSFVTSGISLSNEELKIIGKVVEKIKSLNSKAKLCASLGQLKKEQLCFLKECGLDRYHHNLETSREFYPKITTKQKWNDRVKTVKLAKEVGFSVCCGGIFGLGESEEDVISIIETWKELQVDSIPVNFLHPIKGTSFENANFLTPLKCLRILTAIRIAIPEAEIRICGGREYNLKELQPLGLFPANALMVGNYLTTKGRSLKDDAEMIKDLGFESNLRI
ncbi:Biotin synthase [Desulfurobacterium thermolithotrophum DSM 11699]|uniref:Biotin synthase n=1 Tax=Desulfurobacterium thermolithotrophum (strain DSM 11699 / BSA) TaxID=868864 RepID=F0S023_DESTD|nr:biotin synthase BioB [Desulfurobacterium thermolithotrophum]ADY73704.1 Biotin synthase [Desulfurobacterium thermolithotrophum DSM 11699]